MPSINPDRRAIRSADGGLEDGLRIDDGEVAGRVGEGDATVERRNGRALLQEVVGVALEAGGDEFAHGLGRDEAGHGVADGCDTGQSGVFHGLANAAKVVAGVADVAQVDGALERDEGSVGLAEPPAHGVDLAVAEWKRHFEDVAGGEALVGDAEQEKVAAQLEDGAEGAVGVPSGQASGGDDGFGLGADGADTVGEVAAAKVAGAAADLVGNGAHVGRGVERVEDEAGGLGSFVVE